MLGGFGGVHDALVVRVVRVDAGEGCGTGGDVIDVVIGAI